MKRWGGGEENRGPEISDAIKEVDCKVGGESIGSETAKKGRGNPYLYLENWGGDDQNAVPGGSEKNSAQKSQPGSWRTHYESHRRERNGADLRAAFKTKKVARWGGIKGDLVEVVKKEEPRSGEGQSQKE